MNEFIEKLKTLAVTSGEKILTALVILVVGIIIVKIVTKIFNKSISKTKLELNLINFLTSIVKFLLSLLLVYIIWDFLSIPPTLFVAITSVAGIAISLALQGVLSNLASGITQISSKRFKHGDYIKIGAVEGTVENIDFTAITLVTPDNKKIFIPNSITTTTEITNFSACDTRRIEINVGVAYGTDINKVQRLVYAILNADKRIFKTPEPMVKLITFGSSSLDMVVRCHTKPSEYWDVYFDLNERIYTCFNENDIEIPFNQLDVKIKTI